MHNSIRLTVRNDQTKFWCLPKEALFVVEPHRGRALLRLHREREAEVPVFGVSDHERTHAGVFQQIPRSLE